MRTFPPALLIFAIVGLSVPSARAAGAAPASLKTFLESEGYGGSQLQRRLGNHLFATTIINGRRMALAIDTGAPFTLVDSASAKAVGLKVQETKGTITGVTGLTERAGVARIATLRMGNCTFLNVPIGVADAAEINAIRGPHLDGLFGAHEMSKFGVVIDCARQMLYVNPHGPSSTDNQNLARFLTGRGFSRIPMSFDSSHHLEIQAKVNGHPVAMIVDTGAASTFLSQSIAYASGAATTGVNFTIGGATGGALPGKIARVHELALGDLIVHNAELTIGESKIGGSGLLGEEYLSWNFGVVDLGGMNLYLRPPELGPAKKR
ncbi:MAG TPA: retroviral-like aspartic protease family protein [Chthoniobacterales bacterium]|jgi:predicted aspartyl protease|nr:retroviral-like aspartic protease family protein [Chthoniobacterales bacterium]